jgi:universal stress protein A
VSIQVNRILVPLDHSAGSAPIVEYACAVARGLGASLTFLHVYDPPNEMIGMVPGVTVAGEAAAECDAGVILLDRASEFARANGFTNIDRIVERGAPASQAITAHARDGKFDLIVMGTHGRSGVSRLVMGSVAEQTLRTAPCPVLTVHLQPK